MRLIALCLIALFLFACASNTPGSIAKVVPPNTTGVTSHLAAIDAAADNIDKLAGASVPEVKAETSTIRNKVADVNDENVKTAKLITSYDAQTTQIDSLKQEIKDEQSKGRTLVNTIIAISTGLGILGVALGFFLRSPSLVASSVGAIIAAAVALFVFKWAWAIALVFGALIVAYVCYQLFIQHKSLREVIFTTEGIKQAVSSTIPNSTAILFTSPDSLANSLQSNTTKSIVSSIRNRFGLSGSSPASPNPSSPKPQGLVAVPVDQNGNPIQVAPGTPVSTPAIGSDGKPLTSVPPIQYDITTPVPSPAQDSTPLPFQG